MAIHTIHGSARTTNAALAEQIAALTAQIAELRAPATVNPEKATAREKFAGFRAERTLNAASKVPGFWCARHEHGFAFKKDACPRDGGPLA